MMTILSDEKKICLGCNCMPEYLDMDAKAVLWINEYYRDKAKGMCLYDKEVEHYVMPKFWQTAEEFCGAKDYCLKVYKTIIAELTAQLEIIHHTHFSERGWNVILQNWLEGYIESFYDKYKRGRFAVEYYPALYVKDRDIWYIPRGNDLQNSEVLQIQQYYDIYQFLYHGNAVVDTDRKKWDILESEIQETEQTCPTDKNIKYTASNILKKMIYKNDGVLLLDKRIYLNMSKTILELLSGGRIRRLELPDGAAPQNIVSINMRKQLKRDIDYGDEFINLIYDCVWKHIPMQFMEDFQYYYEISQKLDVKMPVEIVDSTACYNDIVFKFFVAEALKQGSKLAIIQHGGNHGLEKYIRSGELEVADKYYTWGNDFVKNNRGNMCAMPLPKTLRIKRGKRGKRGGVLFVGYMYRPFVSCFWHLWSVKMEELYREEDIFFQGLRQECQKELTVRCDPNDSWWERKTRLAQKFPWMRFDSNRSYYKSMAETRLVVTNLISTTYIEAINCDIPTLIFCSEKFFVPDENAVGMLNELRRVKVFLDNPYDAADFVNQHLDSIDSWWKEPERKAVVDRFREMYGSRGKFPKWKWIREMLKESKAV